MLKKVFNWSEFQLSEMTCYKIYTLVSSFGIGCWIRRTRWAGNFSTIYLQNVVSLVVSDHAPCTPDLKDTSKVRQNKSLDHLSSFSSTGLRAYNGTTKLWPYTYTSSKVLDNHKTAIQSNVMSLHYMKEVCTKFRRTCAVYAFKYT